MPCPKFDKSMVFNQLYYIVCEISNDFGVRNITQIHNDVMWDCQ